MQLLPVHVQSGLFYYRDVTEPEKPPANQGLYRYHRLNSGTISVQLRRLCTPPLLNGASCYAMQFHRSLTIRPMSPLVNKWGA